jgi:hypothetical protein
MKARLRYGYAERSFLTLPVSAPHPQDRCSPPVAPRPRFAIRAASKSGRTPDTLTGQAMTKTISLKLTEDEIEMLVDALEVDLEGYLESAKEARGNNNREDVKTFTEAAERIQALTEKLRALLPDEL